jgi:hypothetical protein
VRVRTYVFPGCFTRPPGTSTRHHPHEPTTSKPVVPGNVLPVQSSRESSARRRPRRARAANGAVGLPFAGGVRLVDHRVGVRISRRELPDLSRSVGGVALALGAVVLLSRGERHDWSHLVRMLVVLVPAAVLYLLAIGRLGRRSRLAPSAPAGDTSGSGDARPEPWRSVLGVTAILLGPVALLELLRWLGVSTGRPLVEAAIFAAVTLVAGYAAHSARLAYAALLAGLSALVAWLIVWGQILDHPSTDAFRVLLVVAAALLLSLGAVLAARDVVGAGELATAGGVAAVTAGVIGIVVGAVVGILRSVFAAGGASSAGGAQVGPPHVFGGGGVLGSLTSHASGLQHFGWDLYLLVISLGLVWIGSRMRVRGLGYVGGAGLLAFLVSVGAQITRLEAGHAPSGSIVGWPLALLILGVAGLLAPAVLRGTESRADRAEK